jgi:hypothetical protein
MWTTFLNVVKHSPAELHFAALRFAHAAFNFPGSNSVKGERFLF